MLGKEIKVIVHTPDNKEKVQKRLLAFWLEHIESTIRKERLEKPVSEAIKWLQ